MNNAVYIKKLNKKNLVEFTELVSVFNIVFENKLNPIAEEKYLLQLLSKNEFVIFAALINNNVVGGLTAIQLPSVYKNESELFIYDIAVLEQHQKQGIGSKLIQSTKDYCNSNNIKIVFVDADADDSNAIKFYKSTGAFSKKVIHFEYDLTNSFSVK